MAIPVFRWLLLSGLLLSSSSAYAQLQSTDAAAVPNAAVPLTSNFQYFSVFTRYQSFREQPVLSWPEANDTVGEIGGWRFYLRDAKQPDTDSSADGARPDAEEYQPSGKAERSDQHSDHGRKP